jgi:hypothetical protein
VDRLATARGLLPAVPPAGNRPAGEGQMGDYLAGGCLAVERQVEDRPVEDRPVEDRSLLVAGLPAMALVSRAGDRPAED